MSVNQKKSSKQIKLNQIIEQMEAQVDKLPLVNHPREIVPAEGNPLAEIMFIGEAAGYHELVQRRPFVGAAGRLLTQTLTQNNLSRTDVWISNILKTRPPDNRDPRPEEIEAYRPFLDREIDIIKPRIIATLGRFSMAKFFGPETKIGQIHGQPRWVKFPLSSQPEYRVVILPLYHPAAALRSTHVKTMFETDFKKLPQILHRLNRNRDNIYRNVPEQKPPSASKNDHQQLTLI